MHRRTLLQAGAAMLPAAVAVAAVAPAPAPAPYPDGTFALYCLGDSITAGSTSDPANGIATGSPGLSTGNGYRSYLLDDLRVRNECGTAKMIGSLHSGTAQLYHEGHPGWTINEISTAVDTNGLAPQYVILLCGANDFGDRYLRTWMQARDDTNLLLDKLLNWAPWVRIVLCEQMLMRGDISHDLTKSTWQQQQYNAALQALADSKAGRVVVARTSVVGQGMLDGSGVHPTDVGYRWMAYCAYYALAPWLGHDVGGGQRWMTNIAVPPGSPRPTWIL